MGLEAKGVGTALPHVNGADLCEQELSCAEESCAESPWEGRLPGPGAVPVTGFHLDIFLLSGWEAVAPAISTQFLRTLYGTNDRKQWPLAR